MPLDGERADRILFGYESPQVSRRRRSRAIWPAAPRRAPPEHHRHPRRRSRLCADTGFTGCKDFATPHIGRLAARGVRFTNACVSHPCCSHTRAGLMTGRYQHRFGHENNPVYDPEAETAGLPTSEMTIANVLSDAGYVTGQIGKWHLGAAPKFHPLRRGFREQFGFIGGGHDYFKSDLANPHPREYLIPIERNGKPVPEPEYLTVAFSREAEAFVRRHARDEFSSTWLTTLRTHPCRLRRSISSASAASPMKRAANTRP